MVLSLRAKRPEDLAVPGRKSIWTITRHTASTGDATKASEYTAGASLPHLAMHPMHPVHFEDRKSEKSSTTAHTAISFGDALAEPELVIGQPHPYSRA